VTGVASGGFHDGIALLLKQRPNLIGDNPLDDPADGAAAFGGQRWMLSRGRGE
jgi:hypothetical protein